MTDADERTEDVKQKHDDRINIQVSFLHPVFCTSRCAIKNLTSTLIRIRRVLNTRIFLKQTKREVLTNLAIQFMRGNVYSQIRDGNGSLLQFRIRPTSKLYKLMDAYCAHMTSPKGSYRFLFDGRRVTRNDTPEALEMRDLDVIDALVFQSGGGERGDDHSAYR